MIPRTTNFSYNRKHRYTLWRQWSNYQGQNEMVESPADPKLGNLGQFVQFIGLNPSTADEVQDDPTIRRCIQFAKDWGFGALCMTNLFGFRETNPRLMKLQADPIGDDNTNQIMDVAREAGLIVAAWGRDGKHLDRGQQIIDCLKEMGVKIHHLGLNKDGTPKHPLYLRADTKPEPFA